MFLQLNVCMCLGPALRLSDSLSMASELKVRAVSKDKQSTVTSPPWMRYQLCLRGVVPSNLSWKPVLELSFIPIRTSSRAHWAECFPTTKGTKDENEKEINQSNFFSNNMAVLCCVFLSQHTNLAVVATTGTLYRRSLLEVAAQWSLPGAPRRN